MSPPMENTRAQRDPLVEQFLATYPEIPYRVLDAIALINEGRIELFRSGETVGAVIEEPYREGDPASYRLLQQEHCGCDAGQKGPQRKCVHLLALEMVVTLAQQATRAPVTFGPRCRASARGAKDTRQPSLEAQPQRDATGHQDTARGRGLPFEP